MYCAVFTSPWCEIADESFHSENFDEVFHFILSRINARGYKSAYIVKEDNGNETTIVSFRNIK